MTGVQHLSLVALCVALAAAASATVIAGGVIGRRSEDGAR
jgi:hypothetical protein